MIATGLIIWFWLCWSSCSGLLLQSIITLRKHRDLLEEPFNLYSAPLQYLHVYVVNWIQIYLRKTSLPVPCHFQNLSYTNIGSCFKQNLFSKTYVQIKCCFNAVLMKAGVYWKSAAVPCTLSLLAYSPSQQLREVEVLIIPSLPMEKLRHTKVR